MKILNYSAKVLEKIDNGRGYINSIRVGVFEGETQIGEYIRNYSGLFNTFEPFLLNGKPYALYSRDYTATRVMELPSCRDLGGEEHETWGFCPREYHAPWFVQRFYANKDGEQRPYTLGNHDFDNGKQLKPDDVVQFYPFVFVAGCIWGDDSSDKVQIIDVSEADKGIIRREERFGYIEVPYNTSLRSAIRMSSNEYVDIAVSKCFEIATGKVDE